MCEDCFSYPWQVVVEQRSAYSVCRLIVVKGLQSLSNGRILTLLDKAIAFRMSGLVFSLEVSQRTLVPRRLRLKGQ